MPQIPVNVQVDFSNVRYANGQWSGEPTWNVPGKVSVHPGTDNNLVWRLTAQQVPAGFSASFAANGIDFSQSPQRWPGSTPTVQGDGTVRCTDNFAPGLPTTSYYYWIHVQLTGAGTPGTFSKDPDVQNESN